VDEGQWLVEHRADLDRAEAVWVEHLARFDLVGGPGWCPGNGWTGVSEG
jgi:hypothetical protein